MSLPPRRVIVPANPIPGVPLPAIQHIVDMLKSGRQMFGAAGASLTWGIGDKEEGGALSAGIEGERMTSKFLSEWVKDYPNAYIAHSIQRPTSVGDTDHMLVIGRFVILIDSKRWKAKRKYSISNKGTIMRGNQEFPEGNINIMPALRDWRAELGKNARVSGIVNIAQDEVFVTYDQNWAKCPYKLVAHENLGDFLDKLVSKMKPEDRDFINAEVAVKILTRTLRPRDRRKELINEDHR